MATLHYGYTYMTTLHSSYPHYWQARKKRDQLRYERKRRGWLVKLLRQARARGLPLTAQLPELDAELRGDAAGSATRRAAATATPTFVAAEEPAAGWWSWQRQRRWRPRRASSRGGTWGGRQPT